MRKFILAAGVAALALSMPALAEKGGNGNGNGKGGQQASQGKDQRAERGNRGARAERGQRAENRGGGRDDARANRGRGNRTERRAVRVADRAERREARVERRRDIERPRVERPRLERLRDREERRVQRRDYRDDGRRYVGNDRCPPGLARKNNGCLPPGQARRTYNIGQRYVSNSYVSNRYDDRYRNSYDRWMPVSYRSFYHDSPDYYYRYDQGNIYRVSSQSNLISALIPLLGGGFSVGQALPSGYDIYNVPMQYRDTYYDSDEAYYRYGDGAIYQVDPQTSLIEGVVALLAGDLNVGRPLPDGYDVYNVPLEYRDRYQDSDDYLYRYGDGGIYQVDAQTQLITAVMEMLV